MNAPAWAAASVRNSGPILDVLRHEFANCRTVLEIGTGTACHAVRFAEAMPALLVELRALLQSGRLTRLVLLFRDGIRVELRRAHGFRVWRRRHPLLDAPESAA